MSLTAFLHYLLYSLCCVYIAVTYFITGTLSLSILSTSSLIPPSLPCPFWQVHRKVKTQHVCLLCLTYFPWRNSLHVHQCCRKGEVSFFFMAEWSPPLMFWQIRTYSLPAPLSMGIRVATVRNTGVWIPLRIRVFIFFRVNTHKWDCRACLASYDPPYCLPRWRHRLPPHPQCTLPGGFHFSVSNWLTNLPLCMHAALFYYFISTIAIVLINIRKM